MVVMFYVKVHEIEGEKMIAVCDREVLGKEYTEGELCLTVSEKFYRGDNASPEELKKALTDATIANLVGENAVEIAIEEGHIDKENTITVSGIPHAQFLVIK